MDTRPLFSRYTLYTVIELLYSNSINDNHSLKLMIQIVTKGMITSIYTSLKYESWIQFSKYQKKKCSKLYSMIRGDLVLRYFN